MFWNSPEFWREGTVTRESHKVAYEEWFIFKCALCEVVKWSKSLLQRVFWCRNTLFYWNDAWQGEEDACNLQLCMISRVLCSLQLHGKGDVLCLHTGHSIWIGFFTAFAVYWGPDLPLPNLMSAWINPAFSTHAVNTVQVSFGALTCKQCQPLHTSIIFRFSLCTAGHGSILVSLSTSTVWRIIF